MLVGFVATLDSRYQPQHLRVARDNTEPIYPTSRTGLKKVYELPSLIIQNVHVLDFNLFSLNLPWIKRPS